jgi:glycosyltransferase involved in cell wall biosynthesis
MEKQGPLISVIVPMYKVEQYLEKCLHSIVNQTYTNLEIILVDDGSPDRCGEICDAFGKQDPRIRVIHKENGGLSDARNRGMDIMTGEFVTFIDSDDYIRADYIECLYEPIAKGLASISICDIQPVNEQGEYLEETPEGTTEILTGEEVIVRELQGKWEFVTAWGTLYPAAVFEQLRFPLQRLYEDEYIFPDIFSGQKQVAHVQKPLYYYLQRSASIMAEGYSPKKCKDYWDMWQERIRKFRGNPIESCVVQSYLAWNVLYMAMYRERMPKEKQTEFKADIRRYFSWIFRKPYLLGFGNSVKLAVKCILILTGSKLLSKRYA